MTVSRSATTGLILRDPATGLVKCNCCTPGSVTCCPPSCGNCGVLSAQVGSIWRVTSTANITASMSCDDSQSYFVPYPRAPDGLGNGFFPLSANPCPGTSVVNDCGGTGSETYWALVPVQIIGTSESYSTSATRSRDYATQAAACLFNGTLELQATQTVNLAELRASILVTRCNQLRNAEDPGPYRYLVRIRWLKDTGSGPTCGPRIFSSVSLSGAVYIAVDGTVVYHDISGATVTASISGDTCSPTVAVTVTRSVTTSLTVIRSTSSCASNTADRTITYNCTVTFQTTTGMRNCDSPISWAPEVWDYPGEITVETPEPDPLMAPPGGMPEEFAANPSDSEW
jgi:hypothetical protein